MTCSRLGRKNVSARIRALPPAEMYFFEDGMSLPMAQIRRTMAAIEPRMMKMVVQVSWAGLADRIIDIDYNYVSTYNRAARVYVLVMNAKSNITLKLDTDLLRKVKVAAAQQNTSISQYLTDQLRKALENNADYERAKRRAFKLMEEGFAGKWTPPRSRDELYER